MDQGADRGFPEAGSYSGRYGEVYGESVPSQSGVGPVIGSLEGGSNRLDYALAVHFEDTQETQWFAPHLVEAVD
jgi:hypothetical protein